MVIRFILELVDLLVIGSERAVKAVVSLPRYAGQLWYDTGIEDLYFLVIEFLACLLGALGRYLSGVQTRLKYRYRYEQVTAPMKARYRQLRRG